MIFKEKRIIQVQSRKFKIHWEILASTRKINLESYSLLLEVFAFEVATFEIKVSAKKYGFVLIPYLFLEPRMLESLVL